MLCNCFIICICSHHGQTQSTAPRWRQQSSTVHRVTDGAPRVIRTALARKYKMQMMSNGHHPVQLCTQVLWSQHRNVVLISNIACDAPSCLRTSPMSLGAGGWSVWCTAALPCCRLDHWLAGMKVYGWQCIHAVLQARMAVETHSTKCISVAH